MERLQKYMSRCSVASRRKSEELILNGKVVVNGKVIKELGYKVTGKEEILVDNKLLKPADKVYYLLNKPSGVISSVKDDKNRNTVVNLIETEEKIFPVGRLDFDTTGLLLLTNDGELANKLIHPKYGIEKTYVAKIDKILSVPDLYKLKSGVVIEQKKTKPAKVKIKEKNKNYCVVELKISEGRNHQVKKMFEVLGYKVLKLKRTEFAFLNINGLAKGEYRRLNIKEIHKLYNLVSGDAEK
jgi:23S rRNA pseudouridine2605 synthase